MMMMRLQKKKHKICQRDKKNTQQQEYNNKSRNRNEIHAQWRSQRRLFVFTGKNKKPTSGCAHTQTRGTPAHTHTHIHLYRDTCECALRHMLVKHTLSARKNEPSAKRTQDILAIILWPGRGLALAIALPVILLPRSGLTAGAIKSAGKSEMKRKQAATGDVEKNETRKK